MNPSPGSYTLDSLATSQDSVLSRAQLGELGYHRWAVQHRVISGRWRLAGTRAVVLRPGPLSTRQQWWCSLINTSPRAALAGVTAAEAGGLQGFQEEVIHVVVPKATRPAHPDGVIVHESRRLFPDDLHPALLPPRTRLARSVVDAALWTPVPAHACAFFAAAVQQRLTTPAELRAVMDTIRRHRHLRLLQLSLSDIEGGAHALSELDFARLCRSAAIPEPMRQAIRLDSSGKRRYLDADWPDFGLAAEIDGSHHADLGQWLADLDRQNEITLGQRRVLRFPVAAMRVYPERLTEQIRRGLRIGGWRG